MPPARTRLLAEAVPTPNKNHNRLISKKFIDIFKKFSVPNHAPSWGMWESGRTSFGIPLNPTNYPTRIRGEGGRSAQSGKNQRGDGQRGEESRQCFRQSIQHGSATNGSMQAACVANCRKRAKLAPRDGLEPPTGWLTATCSTN